MFILISKGIMLGLILSFMIGPLFFTVVQAALEHGFRAGLAVASGIWASDVVCVFLLERSISALEAIASSPDFKYWASLASGIILICFGLVSLLLIPRNLDPDAPRIKDVAKKGYFGLWLKGFLVNSLNPGTLLFWLSTATGVVATNGWELWQSRVFFGSMLIVLCCTDLIKIYASKHLRRWLTPVHILMVRRGIGIVLVAFGIALLIRN